MKGMDYMLEINMGLNYLQRLLYHDIKSIIIILFQEREEQKNKG